MEGLGDFTDEELRTLEASDQIDRVHARREIKRRAALAALDAEPPCSLLELADEMDPPDGYVTTVTSHALRAWAAALRAHAAAEPAGVEEWRLVQELSEDELSSVTIFYPNPDFGGSDYAIETCGPWTEMKDRRFEGESPVECLRKALEAKRCS